jgi:hypothetical protein
MITIQTQLFQRPVSGKDDWRDRIQREAANTVAKGMAERMQEALKERRCSNDHEALGRITLIADVDRGTRIEKTGFCCATLADSITFDLLH